LADELYAQYGWYMVGLASNGLWTVEELQILWDAATAIEAWFATLGGSDARSRMRGALGGTQFTKAGIVGNLVLPGNHHVRGSKVHLLFDFDTDTVVHEIGHVLDNRLGTTFMAALLGGGPADEMAWQLGFDAVDNCIWNRSQCSRYTNAELELKENFPSSYAGSGPSEDFAETFRLSVLSPSSLGPIRTEFITGLGHSLTTNVGEFQGSPYTALQRSGQGYITPHAYGGGGPVTDFHFLQ
jgi:hypothetical protein